MELLLFHNKIRFMLNKSIFISIVLITSIFMSCSDIISNYPDLGSGYKFFHEGKYGVSIVDYQNTQIIKNTVLEYDFDSIFIVVSQFPWDSISGRQTMTYTESNKAFENSSFKQYWIINKAQESVFNEMTKGYSNVFGPYSKEEYLCKRKELGVLKELKLKRIK